MASTNTDAKAEVKAETTSPEKRDAHTEPLPQSEKDITYGGHSRFDCELEFVSLLANPRYLQHLATQKVMDDPKFIAYLKYLQYWKYPPYLKYLMWPGPTLKHLELLQIEKFRQEIIRPEVVTHLEEEGMRAAVLWHKQD